MAKKGSQYSSRVIFPKGKQSEYIKKTKVKLNFNNKKLSNVLSVSSRTINAWENEGTTMPKKALVIKNHTYGISIPKKTKSKKPFWNNCEAGKEGGKAIISKYGEVGGDKQKRKNAWLKWWQEKGQHKKEYQFIGRRKKINKPKLNTQLAEFTGIVLGDGSITKYQVTITLNQSESQYIKFVTNLTKKLFSIEPTIIHRKDQSVKNIVISSRNMVEFLTEEIGLKTGNKVKQNVSIPDWIFKKKSFQKACLRGLMDTDGCVATHKYISNNKQYNYRKIILTNYSKNIIENSLLIFKNVGIKTRVDKNRKRIWIDGKEQVSKFIKKISSNNKRHLEKYNGEVHRIGKVTPC